MDKYGGGTHNFEQEAPLGSCLEDIRIEGRASSMKSIMFRRSGETRYGALQNSDSPRPNGVAFGQVYHPLIKTYF